MALLCHEILGFGIPAQSEVVVFVGSDEEVIGWGCGWAYLVQQCDFAVDGFCVP
jgi:hypothetical protein